MMIRGKKNILDKHFQWSEMSLLKKIKKIRPFLLWTDFCIVTDFLINVNPYLAMFSTAKYEFTLWHSDYGRKLHGNPVKSISIHVSIRGL